MGSKRKTPRISSSARKTPPVLPGTSALSTPGIPNVNQPPPLPLDHEEDKSKHAPLFIGLAILLALALLLFALWSAKSITAGTGGGGTGSTGTGQSDTGEGESASAGASRGNQGLASESEGGDSNSIKQNRATQEDSSEQAAAEQIPANQAPSPASEKSKNTSPAKKTDVKPSTVPTPQEDVDELVPEKKISNTFFIEQVPTKLSQLGGSSAEKGEGSEADFFGVSAAGKKFVYVVDVSSSMSGEKFSKARQELIDSINRLKRKQSFYVAFFNHQPYYQPIDNLVPARSKKRKKEIKEWIDRAMPSGGTNPMDAISRAIDLNPDAIFLLSDGEFHSSVVSQCHTVHQNFGIVIHTIGFQIDSAALKQIASDNHGEYRFVP